MIIKIARLLMGREMRKCLVLGMGRISNSTLRSQKKTVHKLNKDSNKMMVLMILKKPKNNLMPIYRAVLLQLRRIYRYR